MSIMVANEAADSRLRLRYDVCAPALLLQFKRFTKNNFFIEKNPTLVTFPVKNLDLKEALPVPTGKPQRQLQYSTVIVGGDPKPRC
jgi:U4/U6.U5 tri-snRNP-associated protein 2